MCTQRNQQKANGTAIHKTIVHFVFIKLSEILFNYDYEETTELSICASVGIQDVYSNDASNSMSIVKSRLVPDDLVSLSISPSLFCASLAVIFPAFADEIQSAHLKWNGTPKHSKLKNVTTKRMIGKSI